MIVYAEAGSEGNGYALIVKCVRIIGSRSETKTLYIRRTKWLQVFQIQ